MQKSKGKHLVFYDGSCGLCDRIVQFLLKVDKKKLFLFAPLQGETAALELADLPNEIKTSDSLILIENYQLPDQKVYLFAKGALRIAWSLGGLWSFIGLFYFLPSIIIDPFYKLIAKNRHRLFKNSTCILPDPAFKDRFLP